MKHAIVIAHPNRDSFNAAVAAAYQSAAIAKGHMVVERDLYQIQFDPRLPVFGLGFAYGRRVGATAPPLEGRKMVSFTSFGAPTEWVKSIGAWATSIWRHCVDCRSSITFISAAAYRVSAKTRWSGNWKLSRLS